MCGSQVFEKVNNDIDCASYGTNQGFLNDSGALCIIGAAGRPKWKFQFGG